MPGFIAMIPDNRETIIFKLILFQCKKILPLAPMKKAIQAIFQRILGFKNYLFVFSVFKIKTLAWEPKDKEGDFNYFLTLLKDEDVVLDIGANLGIMTVLMARKCVKGKVYAFEPVPDNFEAMARVVKFFKLKNVELNQVALGEESGKVEIRMPILKGVKMQGLSHVDHNSIEGYDADYVNYEVPLKRLDEWPFPENEIISAIKIDVENYEQFVFKGGKEVVRKHKPMIYCELWDNENRKNTLTLLENEGYTVKVLDNDQLVDFSPSIHSNHNFFILPETLSL